MNKSVLAFTAIIAIALAVQSAPAKAQNNIAIDYARQSNGDKNRFVQITPNKPGALQGQSSDMATAYRYLFQKRFDLALESFQRLYQNLGPDDNVLYGLAMAYQKQGRDSTAINIWQQLLKNERLDPVMQAYAQLNLSILQPTDNQTLQNIADLAINKADKSAIFATLGQVFTARGELQRAQESFRSAAALAPDNMLYTYNLGVSYDRLGKSQQALQHYLMVEQQGNAGRVLSPVELKAMRQRIRYLKKG